jgi:hypothetical protein
MKINHTAGSNKGQRLYAWVLVDKKTGEPRDLPNRTGIVVFACRREAEDERWSSEKAVKFRYEHLGAVYRRNRRLTLKGSNENHRLQTTDPRVVRLPSRHSHCQRI